MKGNTQDNDKNIIKIMLEASGVEIIDLGKSVPCEKFIDAAKTGVDFIGLSIYDEFRRDGSEKGDQSPGR